MAWVHVVMSVCFTPLTPWLPTAANSGMEPLGKVQNCEPKMALVSAPDCCRSP